MDRRARASEYQRFQEAVAEHEEIAREVAFHLNSMDETRIKSIEIIVVARQ